MFLDDETHPDGVNEEDDAKKRNRSRRLAASKALVANSDFDWDVKATGSGSAANRHSLDSSVGSHTTTPGAAVSGSTDPRRNTPAAAASSQSKKRGRPPGSKNSTPKAKKPKISRPSQSAEDDGRAKIDRIHYVRICFISIVLHPKLDHTQIEIEKILMLLFHEF